MSPIQSKNCVIKGWNSFAQGLVLLWAEVSIGEKLTTLSLADVTGVACGCSVHSGREVAGRNCNCPCLDAVSSFHSPNCWLILMQSFQLSHFRLLTFHNYASHICIALVPVLSTLLTLIPLCSLLILRCGRCGSLDVLEWFGDFMNWITFI